MITIGYKSKFSSILRALCAIAIGLVMIVSNDATVTVVRIIAAFLFASGIVSFVHGYIHRKDRVMGLMTVNAFVDMVLGLILFLFPSFVAGFIVFIIGIVLVCFGLMQLFALTSVMSLLGAGFFTIILSILAIVGGVVLLLNPFGMKMMSFIAGLCLILYGIQELHSAWRMDKAIRTYDDITAAPKSNSVRVSGTDLSDVEDVDYKKVDRQ